MALEVPQISDTMISVCAWCGFQINKNGIRYRVIIEKEERENCSNGICLVCSIENFR